MAAQSATPSRDSERIMCLLEGRRSLTGRQARRILGDAAFWRHSSSIEDTFAAR
jgi:hypothetical protein